MKFSSTINTQKLSLSLGSFCFMLLFVGFVLYHTLVLNQLIPDFLGGFFVQASTLALMLLAPFTLRFVSQTLKTSLYLSFFHLVAFALVAITTIIYIYYDGLANPAVLQSFLLLFCWIVLILVGYFFIQHPKEKSLKILLLFSGLFFLYAIFYMVSEGRFMLNFGAVENSDIGNVAGYQSIARSFLLISFFCIAFLKNNIVSIIATIGFAVLLFAIGARSEFYTFIAAILAYHFLLSLKLKTSMIAIIIILVSSVGLGTYFFDQISESRQFQIVNLDESSSWNARKQFEEKAIRDIKNNPILGDFGGHVRDGSVGEGAHNIYSAYSNYGLIFFILFLLINLYIFIKSTVKLIQLPNNKEWNFLFLLSFSVVLLLFTSKSVFWEVPYLLWGAYFGVCYTEKTQLVLNKTT